MPLDCVTNATVRTVTTVIKAIHSFLLNDRYMNLLATLISSDLSTKLITKITTIIADL